MTFKNKHTQMTPQLTPTGNADTLSLATHTRRGTARTRFSTFQIPEQLLTCSINLISQYGKCWIILSLKAIG